MKSILLPVAAAVVEVEVAGAAVGVAPNENDCDEVSWTLTELQK